MFAHSLQLFMLNTMQESGLGMAGRPGAHPTLLTGRIKKQWDGVRGFCI